MPEALTSKTDDPIHGLSSRFRETRALTEALVAPLSEADAMIQSMDDASPSKWHLAHTTWFWETFLLREHADGYALFDERYPFLFNSYYEAEGERHARCARGMITRPSLADVLDYRAHVTEAMEGLLTREELQPLIDLGVAHEQQHIELLLTDIKHALFQNPLGPAIFDSIVSPSEGWDLQQSGETPVDADSDLHGSSRGWYSHPGGIAKIGHSGAGFAFDNEGPAHRVLLEPFALADRLVTNRDWDEFIADGGYETASLWLSDGWAWVQNRGVDAPLYWRENEHFTLAGYQERDPEAPVTHISHYEADAFACWADARLPTEFEWEAIGQDHDPADGNQLDAANAAQPTGGKGLFGDCWQFTRSAYLPYPRYAVADGAVGEYNGKFMSGQVVLRGASCATVRGHSRSSYRNFFYPHQRWQFTGLRLAKDV